MPIYVPRIFGGTLILEPAIAYGPDTLVQIVRLTPLGTLVIVPSAIVQLDKRAMPESGGYEGAEPHFIYDGFTTQVPISNPQLIRQDDLLIDLRTNDPLTGKPRQWRIKSDPEVFFDWHWEFECVRYRGA